MIYIIEHLSVGEWTQLGCPTVMCDMTEVIHAEVFGWNWAVIGISIVSVLGLLAPNGLFIVSL